MPETLEAPKGTAIASPEPKPEPKWISQEEVEKTWEKMLFKNYVRKGDEKDAKKFFYRIQGMHPYQPAGFVTSTDDCLFQFEVQKYYRNKTKKTNVLDEHNPQVKREVDSPLHVDGHEMKGGKWVCVDPWASFFMDVRAFKEKFELDTE